jgi:hypothetical protein
MYIPNAKQMIVFIRDVTFKHYQIYEKQLANNKLSHSKAISIHKIE